MVSIAIVRQNEKCLIILSLAQLGEVVADLLSWIGWVLSILSDTKATRKIAQKIPVFRGMLCFNRGGRTFLIRKGQSAPHSSAFGASLRARAKNGGLQCPAFASTGFLL